MPEEKKEAKNSKDAKEEKFATKVMLTKDIKNQTPAVTEVKPEPSSKSGGNPWILATVIFLIISIALGIILLYNNNPQKKVSKDIASQEVSSLVKDVFGVDLKLDSIDEKEDLYELTYTFSGRKFLILATKDVSFIKLPNGNWIRKADFDEETNQTQEAPEATPGTPDSLKNNIQIENSVQVTKSGKPKVELFVMSLCPYTLQAEKGIIPAIEALVNKIDFKIRFMHYVLEGTKEDEENKRQICIREEQSNKLLPYLKCFLNSSKSADCINKASIDSAKLDSCIKNKALQYYLNDSKLSKAYNIESSPTLLVNSNKMEFFPRDSTTALEIICSAFTTKPAECSQELSTENPSPAFGTGSDDKNIAGFCG